MRKTGEFNYFNNNSYNFLNKLLKFNSVSPFGHLSANEKR
jgi:hypothetical protein